MAVQGKNAAYSQLNPLQGDISRDIQYWNQDGNIKRREKRIQGQVDFQKQQQLKKEKQDLYDKFVKPLNNYDTKSTSLNEINGRLLQQATDQYVPLLDVIEDPDASAEQKLKARLKLKTINQLPENLKMVTDFYTNQHSSYQKGIQDGSIYKNENYEKAFQNGFSDIQLGLDEQGLPTVAFVDADGDGVLDVQSFEQIKKGLPTFDFQRKVNFEGLIDKVATDLGTVEKQTADGFIERQTKGISGDDLNMFADKLFEKPDVLNSALRDYGLDSSAENIERIKTDFKKSVLAKTDRTDKTEIDNSGRTAASREARLARDSKSKKPRLSEAVTPTKETWGDNFDNINSNQVNSVGVSGVRMEAVRDANGNTISDAEVQNYTYDNSGNMVLDVVYPKTKSITKNDFSELERKAATGDENAKLQLELAQITGDGGIKVVIPGQNERKSFVVPKEDEAKVANDLGETVESARNRAYKGDVPEQKQKIQGF